MKKLVALVLALLMMCMLLPTMAEEDITGEWYANYMGLVMKLTLNADNSATVEVTGTDGADTGTWALNGSKFTLKTGDVTQEGTYENGVLTLADADQSISFSREPIESITIAAVNPDAAASDFDGEWKIAYIGVDGMAIDASQAGEDFPGLLVENSSVKFTGGTAMNDLFGNDALALTFAGGALSYNLKAGDVAIALRLEILQDGMLSLLFDMGSGASSMYFTRVEAE